MRKVEKRKCHRWADRTGNIGAYEFSAVPVH